MIEYISLQIDAVDEYAKGVEGIEIVTKINDGIQSVAYVTYEQDDDCKVTKDTHSMAEFITRAANSHNMLVNLLEQAVLIASDENNEAFGSLQDRDSAIIAWLSAAKFVLKEITSK